MAEALTWTQFATVMGLLVAVSGVAAYYFRKWLEVSFGEIKGTLAGIGDRLDRLAEGQAEMDRRLSSDVAELKVTLSERLARLEGAFEGHLERGGA